MVISHRQKKTHIDMTEISSHSTTRWNWICVIIKHYTVTFSIKRLSWYHSSIIEGHTYNPPWMNTRICPFYHTCWWPVFRHFYSQQFVLYRTFQRMVRNFLCLLYLSTYRFNHICQMLCLLVFGADQLSHIYRRSIAGTGAVIIFAMALTYAYP